MAIVIGLVKLKKNKKTFKKVLTLKSKYAIIIIEIRKEVIIMAKGMTPAKRHQIRAKYEAQDQARKNERLGLRPKLSNKKGKRR